MTDIESYELYLSTMPGSRVGDTIKINKKTFIIIGIEKSVMVLHPFEESIFPNKWLFLIAGASMIAATIYSTLYHYGVFQ
jgi:hypothetical protein